jgi:hypothetical protein
MRMNLHKNATPATRCPFCGKTFKHAPRSYGWRPYVTRIHEHAKDLHAQARAALSHR